MYTCRLNANLEKYTKKKSECPAEMMDGGGGQRNFFFLLFFICAQYYFSRFRFQIGYTLLLESDLGSIYRCLQKGLICDSFCYTRLN